VAGFDRDEAIAFIRAAVADSLALDLEQVRLDSRLITDLGATSLDFIDLIFTLEKRFGVQIQESELDFVSKLNPTAPDAMQKTALPAETVDKLKAWLPALATVSDPGQVTPAQVFSMITVETLWLLVERKLDPTRRAKA
jgi:acyl carrier protein